MEEKGMGLEELKKRYSELQAKYSLPSFEEMNKDFYIEKVAETQTELLVREIRRMVGDRLANYMRFVENLLNPVNVPMFVYSIVKLIGTEEKNQLSEIYKELIRNEIKFIERDLEFDEEKEALFVREIVEKNQERTFSHF
jgi:hypothetical protein